MCARPADAPLHFSKLMRTDRLVKAAVAALEDIKARDIVVLDVKRMTSLFDRIIIASADSSRQARALSGNLQEKIKAAGVRVQGVEGERAGEWILVDLGAVVVHIMQPAVRQHFNLEELWTPPARSARRRARSAA
jgi:ribosome-associated protein